MDHAKIKKSLFKRLIFWFLSLSIIPLLFVGFIQMSLMTKESTRITLEHLYQGAESKEMFLENWFRYRLTDLSIHSNLENSVALLQTLEKKWLDSGLSLPKFVKSYSWLVDVGDMQHDLVSYKKTYDYVYDVLLFDLQGNLLYSVEKEDDLGLNLFTSWLSTTKMAAAVSKTLTTGKVTFSDLERYKPSHNGLFGFLSTPLISHNGDTIGIVVVQISFDKIFKNMEKGEGDFLTQDNYFVGTDGLLRTPISDDTRDILKKKIDTKPYKLWKKELALKSPADEDEDELQSATVSEYINPVGKLVIGVRENINLLGVKWLLISEVTSKEVFSAREDIKKHLFIILLMTIFAVVLIAFYQTRKITSPLRRLVAATRDFAQGGSAKVDIQSEDEIKVLADAFNQMVDKRDQSSLEIEKSNKKTKKALRNLSSQKFALDQHSIVSMTDPNGLINFVNSNFCIISGYSSEELLGNKHNILRSEIHRSEFFDDLTNIIKSGKTWHGDICSQTKNGELFWVRTTAVPFLGGDGKIQSYIYISTDITKQKQHEQMQLEQLQISEIKLELSQSLASAKNMKDSLKNALTLVITLPNFQLKKRASLYTFDIETKSYSEFIFIGENSTLINDWEEHFIKEYRQVIETGKVIHVPLCTHTTGEDGPHGHFIVPLINKANSQTNASEEIIAVIFFSCTAKQQTDKFQLSLLEEIGVIVTQEILRHRANDILENAMQLAEQNNQLKGEFLASMSHEIRTPMNGVLGMLNLLVDGQLEEDQLHKAMIAKSSAESLLVIINDILDFSKIEAGKLELEYIDFDLSDTLENLITSVALPAHEKGVEVILDLTQIDNSMAKGDPGRLRQVLTNLINNAIKFTSEGQIRVTAKLEETAVANELCLTCSIEDSGIGIPASKVKTLFDKFTQVDASTTREYGGTGLGLAICKNLVEMMHGQLTVNSQIGEGSCFTFTAFLEKSSHQKKIFSISDVSQFNVLIVDDNAVNCEVLQSQLEKWGVSVSAANSGEEALIKCQENMESDDRDFDIAILDMQMPGMDGIMLGQKLRKNINFKDIKLVMMTSLDSEKMTDKFNSVGFDAYFPKPTTATDLFKTLQIIQSHHKDISEPMITTDYLKIIGTEVEPSVQTAEADDGQTKIGHAKVLLVEDNKVNQMVATFTLKKLGIENVVVADDGLIALERLKACDGDEPFDIILMDCQMPNLDGYQTAKAIRSAEAGEHFTSIAIIAMTANAMEGDKEKCLLAGMNDYLTKPIDIDGLNKKLARWLDK